MVKVGYVHGGYAEKRNILSLQSSQYKHVKSTDVFKLRDYIYFKNKQSTNIYTHNSFDDRFAFPKADLYHFFNGINYGKKPWVSTFEALMPRYKRADTERVNKGIKALLNNNCKKLIAFSNHNLKNQINFLNENYSSISAELIPKVTFLHPPQNIQSNVSLSRFENIDTLELLFVGHDFFRKGGREVFQVVEDLHKSGANIHLTIVSKLEPDTFITKTSLKDKSEWLNKIHKSKFCTHYTFLENKGVLDLMNKAHILVFPSLHETFGYIVLEAQANGLPVITTDISAFPEINNDQCGWLIDVPKTHHGFTDIYSEGLAKPSEIISQELKAKLKEVLNDLPQLKDKASRSLTRVQNNHSIDKFSKNLIEIYTKAMS